MDFTSPERNRHTHVHTNAWTWPGDLGGRTLEARICGHSSDHGGGVKPPNKARLIVGKVTSSLSVVVFEPSSIASVLLCVC